MNSSDIDVREVRALRVALQEESITVDLADGRTLIVPLLWYPRRFRRPWDVWDRLPRPFGR